MKMEWAPGKEHFRWIRSVKYKKIDDHVDYFVERDGDILYVLFQESNDKEDWASNLNFFQEEFVTMSGTKVKAHRGIKKQYIAVQKILFDAVLKDGVKVVRGSGFSLGCGLLSFFVLDLAEYVKKNNLDIKIEAFGYSGPRVFKGNRYVKKLMKKSFVHIKNRCDPVVHVPWKVMPTFFYFRWGPFKLHIDWKGLFKGRLTRWMHVGKQVWIGKLWPWPVKHKPEEIEKSLQKKYGR